MSIDRGVLPGPSYDVVEALMQDPEKRELVLQYLAQCNKKNTHRSAQKKTPLKKFQKPHCESPTVLLRRLELQKRDKGVSGTSSSTSSSSSEVKSSQEKPVVPFDQLLKGVVGFVDVYNRGQDKSESIKAVMKCMGARVVDKFTGDVTHVIFKDGSSCTYEKAQLTKAHLVSMLWLEAVRKNNCRVPEKNYRANGVNIADANVSMLFSQIQKDFEDIIKDEKRRRSFDAIKPTDKSKLTDTNRRKTMMTPASSVASYHTPEDEEVSSLLSKARHSSPSITSDETYDEEGSISPKRKRPNYLDLLQVSPILTEDGSNASSPQKSPDKSHRKTSNESKSLIGEIKRRKPTNKTINMVEDMVITPSPVAKKLFATTEPKKNLRRQSSSTMSSLRLSSEGDPTKSGLESFQSNDKPNKSHTSLKSESSKSKRKSKARQCDENDNSNVGSTMSALRLSDGSSKSEDVINKSYRTSSSSVRTRLDEKFPDKNSNNIACRGPRLRSLSVQLDRNVVVIPTVSVDTNVESGDNGQLRRPLSACSNADTEKQTSPVKVETAENDDKDKNSGSKKTRKLYSPTQVRQSQVSDDDKERQERARKIKNTKAPPDDVFINPNNILMAQSPSKSNKSNTDSESESEDNLNVSPDEKALEKKVTKRKNKEQTEAANVSYDSDADEQRELLHSLEKKTSEEGSTEKRRRSLRTPQPRKILPDASSSEKRRRSQSISLARVSKPRYTFYTKRRSTMDFESATQTQRKLKPERREPMTIVGTKMHRHEILNLERIVAKLGVFSVEDKVTQSTTHLVVGESKRTLNMLRAIARGCWVLKHEWLLDSAKESKWLPEEEYEVTNFSLAIQQCRVQRQAFGKAFTIDVFKNCGNIYIAKKTTPAAKDLRELVVLAQGTLTIHCDNAKVIVGEFFDVPDTICVSESWILDSITFNTMKKLKNYRIEQSKSPSF